jgi:4-carboxymuconolactone decarboxylase
MSIESSWLCGLLCAAGLTLALTAAAAGGAISPLALRARDAEITGQPPRLAPLKATEFNQQQADAYAVIRKDFGLANSSALPEYFATMLRNPALAMGQAEFARVTGNGALASRDRDLVILRTTWLCQSPYEWGEHVAIGKRGSGFTTDDIVRITAGSSASGWNVHDRAILRAVEELRDQSMISDATWAALAHDLNEQQLLELPLLVGEVQGASYLLNAVRFRLNQGNPGLSAR